MKSATITKEARKMHLEALDEVTLSVGEGKQLEFEFEKVYGDLELKEAQANVKAIIKAGIRLGVSKVVIEAVLQGMAEDAEIIPAAINAIDMALS